MNHNNVIVIDSGNKIYSTPIYIKVSTEDINDGTSSDMLVTIQDVPITSREGEIGEFDIGQLQYNVCTGVFHGIQMDVTPFRNVGMSPSDINNTTRHLVRKMILITALISKNVPFEGCGNIDTVIFDVSENDLDGSDGSGLLDSLRALQRHENTFEIDIDDLITNIKINTANGFAPLTYRDEPANFLRNSISSNLTDVPYIGEDEVVMLSNKSITNTYQLIGKFLMFTNTDDGNRGLYRFIYFLQETGIEQYKELGKLIAEKANTMIPGVWDSAAYDDDDDDKKYDEYERTQRIYPILLAVQRLQKDGEETYRTTSRDERRELARHTRHTFALNGPLAFEMLTTGKDNEIWRNISKFL